MEALYLLTTGKLWSSRCIVQNVCYAAVNYVVSGSNKCNSSEGSKGHIPEL